MVGRPVSVLLDSDDPTNPSAIDMHALDLSGRRADGSTFPMEMTIVAADVPSEPFYVATFRDVTERRDIERMRDEFIANLSHELHTPLTAITGVLEMLALGLAGDLPDRAQHIVAIGHRNGKRLVSLVDDILDHGRMKSSALTFDMRQHDLSEIVADAVTESQGYADQFGVELTLSHVDADVCVHVDRRRMAQALSNLLGNAAKFSPEGGAVTITVRRVQAGVEVTVTDAGPGIPPELHDRVFGRFYQVDSSSTRERGGAGLGLSIAKGIVEEFGGRIGVESRVGEGATFRVSLPEWDGGTDGRTDSGSDT